MEEKRQIQKRRLCTLAEGWRRSGRKDRSGRYILEHAFYSRSMSRFIGHEWPLCPKMTHTFNAAVEEKVGSSEDGKDEKDLPRYEHDEVKQVRQSDIEVEAGETTPGEEIAVDSSTGEEESVPLPANMCEEYILNLLDLDECEVEMEAGTVVNCNATGYASSASDAVQDREEQDDQALASHTSIRLVCRNILRGCISASAIRSTHE
jgi:hypothetical protein